MRVRLSMPEERDDATPGGYHSGSLTLRKAPGVTRLDVPKRPSWQPRYEVGPIEPRRGHHCGSGRRDLRQPAYWPGRNRRYRARAPLRPVRLVRTMRSSSTRAVDLTRDIEMPNSPTPETKSDRPRSGCPSTPNVLPSLIGGCRCRHCRRPPSPPPSRFPIHASGLNCMSPPR